MGAKAKANSKTASSKRADEARKKELVCGEGVRMAVLDAAHVTGILTSRPAARDVVIDKVEMSLHGRQLIQDTSLCLNHGRRYGLIGNNGSGKSTLLAAIAARELPIPDHIDMWFVHMEAEPSDISA